MMYIVSMTSFGDRLMHESKYAINSILNNTILPDKICITINNFDKDNIPEEYKNNLLIEIIISNDDIKPHNKYYHVMKKYRNDVIITIDDDIIYPKYFLEKCIKAYNDNSNVINAFRIHKITYNDKNIMPYKLWKWNYNGLEESYDNFFTGCWGVVYPPGIFNDDDLCICNIKEYLYVDDIYLNYLCRKHKIKIKRIDNDETFYDINILKNKYSLCNRNVLFNNDLCLRKINFNKILNYCKND